MLASATTHAASSHVALAIKMTVVPSACQPMLSNAGVLDYGDIQASKLKKAASTSLGAKDLQLTMNCDAPTHFALRLHDNRAGTGAAAPDSFGLGRSAGHNIGSYHLRIEHVVADGASLTLLRSNDEGIRWQTDTALLTTGALYAFAPAGTNTPSAHEHLTADVSVQTQLLPANELTLSDAIILNGSTTLEVVYL